MSFPARSGRVVATLVGCSMAWQSAAAQLGGDPLFTLVSETTAEDRLLLSNGFALARAKEPQWRSDLDPAELMLQVREIERRARDDPYSSRALHRLGQLRLLQHRWNEAELALKEAARQSGADWRPQNDLAVTMLLRAGEEDDFLVLLQALETLTELHDGSLGSTPDIEPVRINLSSALRMATLRHALPSFDRPGAQERAADTGNVQKVRERLLESIAARCSAHDPENDESLLGGWVVLANRVFEATQDRYLLDLIEEWSSAAEPDSDPPPYCQLQSAVSAMREGRYERARDISESIKPRVQRHSIVDLEASLLIATEAYFRDPASALRLLDRLRTQVGDSSYHHLKARIDQLLGLTYFSRNEWRAAEAAYRRGEEDYGRAQDPIRAAQLRTYRAQTLGRLGRFDDALRILYQSLRSIPADEHLARHNALFITYEAAEALGFRASRLWLSREMEANAEASGHSGILAESLSLTSRSLFALDRYAAALQKAEQAISSGREASLSPKVLALYELNRVLAEAQVSPATALRRIGSILSTAPGWREIAARYHFAAAGALSKLSEFEAAETELLQGLRRVADPTEVVAENWQRPGLVRDARASAIRILLPELEAGQPDASRIRHLARLARSPFVIPLSRSERLEESTIHRPELPPRGEGTDLSVEYLQLEDEVLSLVNGPAGLELHRRRISAPDLTATVADARLLLSSGSDPDLLESLLQRLYDLLISPFEHHLAPDRRLSLTLDGTLHLVPFSALRSRRGGGYLVEQSIPVVATPLVPSRLRPRGRTETELQAALLAPADSGLPHATSVAQVLESSYRTTRLVSDLSVDRIRRAAETNDVLHVAAHARLSLDRPDLSRIVLDGLPDGGVSADRLRDWNLSGLELLYLATCGTPRTILAPAEEPNGLVTSALFAGARSVVAALWPIADRDAARFSSEFYRRLNESRDSPMALAEAQRQFAAQLGAAGVGSWAAYVVYRKETYEAGDSLLDDAAP